MRSFQVGTWRSLVAHLHGVQVREPMRHRHSRTHNNRLAASCFGRLRSGGHRGGHSFPYGCRTV